MKYYIAYGSNINTDQMAYRCPDATVVCTATLHNHELVFRGSPTSAVATVEKKRGESVPVVVWKISRNDEKALDVYEGYPRLYDKEMLNVKSDTGKSIRAMAYVMTPGRPLGMPNERYQSIIVHGYKEFGFDTEKFFFAVRKYAHDIMELTLEIDRIARLQRMGEYTLCPRCGKATMKERLHTNALSRRADIYICDSCGMIEALNDAKGITDGVENWKYIRMIKRDA